MPSKKMKRFEEELNIAIEFNKAEIIANLLKNNNANFIAKALRRLSTEKRKRFWQLFSSYSASDAANYLDLYSDNELLDLMAELPAPVVTQLFEHMHSEDRRLLVNKLPEFQQKKLAEHLPKQWGEEEKEAFQYALHSAGGICKSEVLKLPFDSTVADLAKLFTDQDENSDLLEWRYLFIHDEHQNYCGAIRTKELFLLKDTEKLNQHIDCSIEPISAESRFTGFKNTIRNINT